MESFEIRYGEAGRELAGFKSEWLRRGVQLGVTV